MEKYLPILKKSTLFAGIGEDDLPRLLHCLAVGTAAFEKNSYVFLMDDPVTSMGLVLEGGVHVVREDFWGNRLILAHMEEGDMFAEALCCAEAEKLPVAIVAAEKSLILLIDYRKIAAVCSSACPFHTRLIKNMMGILARKNIMLTQKIEHITRRTTREKLLSYLSARARQAESRAFSIPFNRQELAEYLAVDRSAMSNELSKMRDEGILKFERNRFELLKP